jgi:hypothetical protein
VGIAFNMASLPDAGERQTPYASEVAEISRNQQSLMAIVFFDHFIQTELIAF